jgi:hypothetical protein
VLGNFTVHTPGGSENILSLEKFEPMVKSVDCTSKGMTLKFIDDETFAYAQKVWDWVNGEDNNTFVMVAGAGDCGTNAHRIPYLVSTIQYDEATNVAHLHGKTDKWKNIVHAYELHVGKAPMPRDRKVKTRAVDDSSAFSVAKAFPFKVKVEVATLLGELECEDCGLGGSLDVDMHINYGLPDIIDAAVFRMTPQNIIAQAHPKLTIGSQKKAVGKWDKDLLPEPIPLYAITLGGFVRLGVFTDVKLGFEAAVEGTLSFTSGATATIPNSAFVEVDFKDLGSGPKSSPWTPDVDMAPLKVSGQAAGTFQLFIMPELKLEASALGKYS